MTLTAETLEREMVQTVDALTWAKRHCCWWFERESALACIALRWGRMAEAQLHVRERDRALRAYAVLMGEDTAA